VIASFADGGTLDVFNGIDSRRAKATCPTALWPVARRKLDQLNRVRALGDLRCPPGNRLERLRRDRADQHSVRINAQYRVCFRWEAGNAYDVEIADYH
jgi:proteic killer suppression protein